MQEQPFEVAPDGAQAIAEIRLHRRLARIAAIARLAVVGEQPGHRDRAEMGAQILEDQQLALAVELLHGQHLFGELVQFLDAPTAVVEGGQVPDTVALAVQQGGGEHVGGRAGGVLDEAHAAGLAGSARDGQWEPERYLEELAELEASERADRRIARLLRESKLPRGKTLERLELGRLPKAVRGRTRRLCTGGFLEEATNVCVFGNPRVGKTHLMAAAGRALVERGQPVLFVAV